MGNGKNPRGGWFMLSMRNGWGNWVAEFQHGDATCTRVPLERYENEGYEFKPVVVMSHEEFDRRLEQAREEGRNEIRHNGQAAELESVLQGDALVNESATGEPVASADSRGVGKRTRKRDD